MPEIKPLIDSQYQANSGFLDEVFGERKEQTIAGCVIGTVRGVFSEPDSAQGQAERAESNDQIAMIAADTIASIPKLKAVTGGLVRASMLVNPHDSLSDNTLSFGTNALEGAALNKVSRLAMPEGAFAKSLTVRLGSGLAAETASHLTVGFGFGAVKTGFNSETWRGGMNAKGLIEGTGQVLKGGSVGALINVPAGMIGVRTAKASTTLLSKEIVSPHVANMIAGAGSGYAAGSVFGGVDAVMHGKKWPDVLTQMHQSGLIGAGTGGLMSTIIGTPKEHQSLQVKKPPTPTWNEVTVGIGSNGNRSLILSGDEIAMSATSKNVLGSKNESGTAKGSKLLGLDESMPSDTRRKGYVSEKDEDAGGREWKEGDRKGMKRPDTKGDSTKGKELPKLTAEEQNDLVENYWFDRLDYVPKEERPDLAILSKRLGKPSEGVETIRELSENAPKKFRNREEFWQNITVSDRPVRVYDVEGHTTKIVVEERYAKELDLLRQQRQMAEKWRTKAEEPCAYDDLPKEQRQLVQASIENGTMEIARNILGKDADHSIEIVKARMAYLRIPQQNKMLPEDFIPFLDELPNPGLIKQLTLVKERNYEDAWLRQTYDKDFQSAATASTTGEVRFYNPSRNYVREFLMHEWSHLVKFGQRQNSRLFDLAMLVDKEDMNMTHPPRGEDGKFPEGELKKGMFFASRYSRRNEDENFAVHMGEYFLTPDGDEFILLARNAPVRVAVFGRALQHEMNASGRKSPYEPYFQERVRYIEERVVPKAKEVLQEYLWHPDPSKRAAAADLLGYIGDESHIPVLKSIAANPNNNTPADVLTTDLKVPTSVSKPKVEGIKKTVAETAFDAMVLLHGDESTRLQVMMQHAQNGSPVKDLAIARMRSLGDSAAHQYANVYQLSGNPANLPQMIELIPKLGIKDAAVQAFHEAMRLAKSSEYSGFEQSLALRVLDRRQDMQSEAMQVLLKHADTLDLKALGKVARYTQVSDKAVADMAKRILLLNKNSRGPNHDGEVPEATWTLYRQHDFECITPLLDAAIHYGNVQAYEALGSFARPVVKHFSRNIRQQTPTQARRLDALLKGSPFPG